RVFKGLQSASRVWPPMRVGPGRPEAQPLPCPEAIGQSRGARHRQMMAALTPRARTSSLSALRLLTGANAQPCRPGPTAPLPQPRMRIPAVDAEVGEARHLYHFMPGAAAAAPIPRGRVPRLSALVVRPFDAIAIELGEGHERHRPPPIDVGALDGDLPTHVFLVHLQDVLHPRLPHRNHEHAAGLELLQQGWGNMIDAAGDDDLVEGGILRPSIVAIRLLGIDGLVLGVAAPDQLVVFSARALGKRLDDLDGPYLVGEVGEVCRLVARAGPDLEHLLAHLDIDGARHAPDHARAGDRHPEADAVVVDVVDDAAVTRQTEFVARGEQECPLVARLPKVDVADHILKAL